MVIVWDASLAVGGKSLSTSLVELRTPSSRGVVGISFSGGGGRYLAAVSIDEVVYLVSHYYIM